jgi:hypothetical protein
VLGGWAMGEDEDVGMAFALLGNLRMYSLSTVSTPQSRRIRLHIELLSIQVVLSDTFRAHHSQRRIRVNQTSYTRSNVHLWLCGSQALRLPVSEPLIFSARIGRPRPGLWQPERPGRRLSL